LAKDIGEQNDRASQNPDLVEKARKLMADEHVPSEIFKMPPLDK
jgi:hypothetical protein